MKKLLLIFAILLPAIAVAQNRFTESFTQAGDAFRGLEKALNINHFGDKNVLKVNRKGIKKNQIKFRKRQKTCKKLQRYAQNLYPKSRKFRQRN